MKTDQLEPLYKEVFNRALFVLTRPEHHNFFNSINIPNNRLLKSLSYRLPGDLFHTTDASVSKDGPFTYSIFGKTGPSKGTWELMSALLFLQKRKSGVRVHATWGGGNLPSLRAFIDKEGLSDKYLRIDPYVPHWHMPNKIRSSDAVLFLENRFKISFHGPGIPAEVNSCGRHLVTTTEIREKAHVQSFLGNQNTSTISQEKLKDPAKLASELEYIADKVRSSGYLDPEKCLDASLQSARSRKFIVEQLAFIKRFV